MTGNLMFIAGIISYPQGELPNDVSIHPRALILLP
jgi:hypothetical protein